MEIEDEVMIVNTKNLHETITIPYGLSHDEMDYILGVIWLGTDNPAKLPCGEIICTHERCKYVAELAFDKDFQRKVMGSLYFTTKVNTFTEEYDKDAK